MRVVATAGHVDHGKSSLVLAITGTDPDRFAEEKRRGLTIDLGFAHTTLPSGAGISFVDVPGHVRFVANMLAGVGSVDACVFVVAATEGWKPQSEEHLRILDLLGVRHGIIALTKVDLVDDEWREIATMEVADHVAGTFLADAPIVPVAAPAGLGVDALRAALDELVAATPAAVDRRRPRLWIDRVFAARGSGTVVTGTLTGGALAVDDHVAVGARALPARIRAIQSHSEAVDSIGPGHRVALNLAGIDHMEVGRGDAVVHPDRWLPTQRFDATLAVLAGIGHEITRRGAYVAHIGSAELPVKVRVLGPEALQPGEDGLVRLHLSTPMPLLPGDRYVLRESGRAETVGGGEVLDIHPVRPASKARPDRDPERLVRERGWVDVDRFEQLTGVRREPDIGRWVVSEESLRVTSADVERLLDEAGADGFDVAMLDERRRAVLGRLDGVSIDAGRVRRAAAPDPLADHPIVGALRDGRFTPPEVAGADRATLRRLVQRGIVIERDGVAFHSDTIDAAKRVVAELLAEHPDGFTVAHFRDATASSRKHALPLLGELDSRGITRRREDLRIAGPRLGA